MSDTITLPDMVLIANDQPVSAHRSEVELYIAAGNLGNGKYTIVRPDGQIVIDRLVVENPEPQPEPEPEPDPEPDPEPLPVTVVGMIPLPDHDPESVNWKAWVATVANRGGKANEHALIGAVTGNSWHCDMAIALAQKVVEDDTVAGNQYLTSGRLFSEVFETLSWCEVPAQQADEWAAWGRSHLGATDGSEGDRGSKIWWKNRWSRNNPANNYYHSFIVATTVYAIATNDTEWLDWLKTDRLKLLFDYYNRTPDGGSREGTGYGESHREVFRIAKMWRDYDGTEVIPQSFIDGSIRFWVHAICPGSNAIAPIGDQTRSKGRVDGYHCDIFDNALQLAKAPDAIALAKWQIGQFMKQGLCFSSHVFRKLVLRDYPEEAMPENVPLLYDAQGAGVLFARTSWEADATFVFFLAGIHDEAHQHDDQGAFAVWADGMWQTVNDSVWTRNGIAQGVEFQNVVRFPNGTNLRDREGKLTFAFDNRVLSINMDLTQVVGQLWRRYVEWGMSEKELRIVDIFDNDLAEFGFEVPSEDDEREQSISKATADTLQTETGFTTIVRW